MSGDGGARLSLRDRAVRLDRRASESLRSLAPSGGAAGLGARSRSGLARVLARSGDAIACFPAIGLAWLATGRSLDGPTVAVAAAAALGSGVAGLAKAAFRRRRPAGDWAPVTRKADPLSFPSGHAARTMAIAAAAGIAAGPVWGLGLAAWSVAVGLARVALGVHWLADVAAGWLLGALSGLAIAPFIN